MNKILAKIRIIYIHLGVSLLSINDMQVNGIQINKYISSTGYCSRREAEKLIEQARVMINDNVALLTDRVTERDTVIVDFEVLKKSKVQQDIIIAFNKPAGITTTTDCLTYGITGKLLIATFTIGINGISCDFHRV